MTIGETQAFAAECVRTALGSGALTLDIEPIQFGLNELWRVRVEHGGVTRDLVLRRYRHWLTWHASDDRLKAEREARALAHVRAYRFPVPAIFGHGADWTLVERVDGKRLAPLQSGDTVDVRAVVSLAGALARLHRLPPPDGPFPRVTVANALLTLRAWAASLGDQRLAAAVERIRRLDEDAPVFVHGDPNLGNVLFDDDMGVAGIIDWEDAAIADRRFDVATAYWLLLLRAPDVAGDFIAAYEAASGRPVRDLRQWLAFQTVRAWAVGGMLRAAGLDIALFSTDDEKAEAERRLDLAGF